MDPEPLNQHSIRLRGPWDVEWLSGNRGGPSASTPDVRQVKLPADWRQLFGERSGLARFRRRFQRPTGLEAHTRVLIVVERVGGEVTLTLGQTPIPVLDFDEDSQRLRFDVTGHLQPTNVLTLDISCDLSTRETGTGGLWRPVLIEILQDPNTV